MYRSIRLTLYIRCTTPSARLQAYGWRRTVRFATAICQRSPAHVAQYLSAAYRKCVARLEGGNDVIYVPAQPKRAKDSTQPFYEASELIVGCYVRSGQVVCDPMLNGRSSLVKAAANAGGRFIGAKENQSRIAGIVNKLSASADSDGLESE